MGHLEVRACEFTNHETLSAKTEIVAVTLPQANL
jgi:hypothetical protein